MIRARIRLGLCCLPVLFGDPHHDYHDDQDDDDDQDDEDDHQGSGWVCVAYHFFW